MALESSQLRTQEVLDRFDELTRNAAEVQRETLKRILTENSDTEYLRRLGLDGRTDLESFKKCVPLVTHEDMEPYIQRIADGEHGVLTSKPMDSMSLSTGTTRGKPKYIPFNEDLALTTMEIYRISFALRNRDYPISKGKALQFIYGSNPSFTKGGLIATTATANVYSSRHFASTMAQINSPATSPVEVIFSPDFHQSLYCHLLCGLLHRDDVRVVSSAFIHSIVNAFRAFELNFEDICTDIRLGVLSDKITVPSIRDAVSRILRPDPLLAELIHTKCKSLTNWYGVIPELWPNAKYVLGIMTGSMEPYLKKLRHYAGALPLVGADYGASEGWIGVNACPLAVPELIVYAVTPHIGFYEFIPVEEGIDVHRSKMAAVGLEEVEVWKEYEVVITNVGGLYRYRLGDIVRVEGFHNSTPLLKFIRRMNVVLSINIDKNTERDLQLAVEDAGKVLAREGLEIEDFTSLADRSTEPGHYVIFVELNKDAATGELLSECCDRLDRAFLDDGYVNSRKVRNIGPLELRVVSRGTFNRIMEHFVSMGSAVSQFKTPRCVGPTNAKVLEILAQGIVGTYFSTAYG